MAGMLRFFFCLVLFLFDHPYRMHIHHDHLDTASKKGSKTWARRSPWRKQTQYSQVKACIHRGSSRIFAKDHEECIAGKGFNSLGHHNLVHKFMPMHQAMHILDAEAAVDKEREKLEKLPAWQVTKVRNTRRGH